MVYEKLLHDKYITGIARALDQISLGQRESTTVTTLSGTTYELEQNILCGPEPHYVSVTGPGHLKGKADAKNLVVFAIESLEEALHLYEQLCGRTETDSIARLTH